MSCLRAIDGVTFTAWIVYLGPVVTGILLWVSYEKVKNRWVFRGVVLGLLLFCAGYTALCFDTLKVQAEALGDCVLGEVVTEAVPITTLALLAGIVMTLLFFGLELLLKSHAILYFLTTILLLLTPLLRVQMTILDLAMLFLFQFFFWGLTWEENRNRSPDTDRDRETDGKEGSPRGHSRRAAVLWVVLPVTFVLALILASQFETSLFDLAYDIEGTVTRAVSERTGMSSMSLATGRISSGNRYQTGTEQLVVTSDKVPEEPMYLRGYSGGTYTGGNWQRATDETLLSDLQEELDWAGGRTTVIEHFMELYYTMNLESGGADEEDRLQIQIYRSGRYGSIFWPYNGVLQVEWYKQRPRTNSRSEYSLSFDVFEQKDLNIRWDNVPEDFEEERDQYAELLTAYEAAIQEPYTRVPEDILPRLTALVEGYPLTDLNDITAFILYTLSTHCTYSLTPGWTPLNEDIVEYFLFDNGKGYCQHFATTATLMYRLYGVPARYAAGYKVYPEDFTETEGGGYEACLTDESAHSWVEIFLPDYGWTPVEVTPSADGVMNTSYPGFDSSDYAQILSSYQWDLNGLSILSQGSGSGNGNGSAAGEDWDALSDLSLTETLDEEQLRDLGLFLIVCLVYALLFLPLVLDARRARLIRRRAGENPRVTFDRLIRMLHFCGILEKYTGSEPDFSAQFLAQVPSVAQGEWQQFYDCVSRIAFGPEEGEGFPEPVSAEDAALAQEIYQKAATEISARLGWWKRQVFTYIRVFGC